MLEIKNLSFGYIKQPLIIKDLDLSINVGEKVAILGGEGMGKTSLLKIIAGLEKQYFGEILIGGRDLKSLMNEEKSISYLPSEPVIVRGSIKKNLDYLFDVIGVRLTESEIKMVFEKFGFDCGVKEKLHKLSLVDKRIFALIRAYIKNAKVILIDDQFDCLSIENIAKIKNAINILLGVNNSDKTVLFVKKTRSDIECDSHVYLSYSKNFQFANIKDLYKNPVDGFVTSYGDFIEQKMLLKNKNNEMFLCAFDEICDKKRKMCNFDIKNMIKIGGKFKNFAEKLKIHDGEFVLVNVVSTLNFEKFSDNEINKLLGSEIFIFDYGTQERLF